MHPNKALAMFTIADMPMGYSAEDKTVQEAKKKERSLNAKHEQAYQLEKNAGFMINDEKAEEKIPSLNPLTTYYIT